MDLQLRDKTALVLGAGGGLGAVIARGLANIVVPGSIMTNRIHALNEAKARRENRAVEDILRESTDAIPVGRHGRPDEYADVVTFLASPRAGYVTGSVVRIDGGMIANV